MLYASASCEENMKRPKSAASPTKRYFFMVVDGEIPYCLLAAMPDRSDHKLDNNEREKTPMMSATYDSKLPRSAVACVKISPVSAERKLDRISRRLRERQKRQKRP